MTAKPKTTEIANIEQRNSSSVLTPMELLTRAVDAGATVEVLAGLMDLQERYERAQERREASQSLKDFDAAISAAKAEIPVIVKNAQGHNYKYADFAAIASVVDPILSKHGLQYRFRTQQVDKDIFVTCVLFGHGHKEETTLSGTADTTGQKNAIQSLGSTLTYLQRYTLVQMLGLATAKDDDGRLSGKTINTDAATDEQVMEIYKLLGKAEKDRVALCKHLGIDALENMTVATYEQAKAAIAARKKRIADAKKEADAAAARVQEAAKGKAGIEQPVTEDGEIL